MKRLIPFFLLAVSLAAQDCVIRFDFTATGNTTPFNNQSIQCTNWTIGYFATGYSALSIQLESAPPGSNSSVPGTFAAWAGTIVSGTHPATATNQAQVYLSGLYPWVQVHLTSATGTGEVIGAAYGYKVANTQFPVAGGSVCGALLTPTCQSPVSYNWTRAVAGTGVTFTDVNGAEVQNLLAANATGGSDSGLQASVIPIPATPYSATLAISTCGTNPSSVGPQEGLVLSDGTKFVYLNLYMPNGTTGANPHPSIDYYTNRTTFSSTPMQGSQDFVGTAICPGPLFLKVVDDGTNIEFLYNANGYGFQHIRCATGCGTNQNLIVSRTAFLTPTQLGWATRDSNGNYNQMSTVYSFALGVN